MLCVVSLTAQNCLQQRRRAGRFYGYQYPNPKVEAETIATNHPVGRTIIRAASPQRLQHPAAALRCAQNLRGRNRLVLFFFFDIIPVIIWVCITRNGFSNRFSFINWPFFNIERNIAKPYATAKQLCNGFA
jgi:hypothetical protein